MSKYKEIVTTIKNMEYITRALDDMGVAYTTGDRLELRDYAGRDSIRYQDSEAKTSQFAQVVVSRSLLGGAAGDLGWTLGDDGVYRCNVDDNYSAVATKIYQGVAQRATLYQLEDLAMENGFTWVVEQDLEKSPNVVRVYAGGGSW